MSGNSVCLEHYFWKNSWCWVFFMRFFALCLSLVKYLLIIFCLFSFYEFIYLINKVQQQRHKLEFHTFINDVSDFFAIWNSCFWVLEGKFLQFFVLCTIQGLSTPYSFCFLGFFFCEEDWPSAYICCQSSSFCLRKMVPELTSVPILLYFVYGMPPQHGLMSGV